VGQFIERTKLLRNSFSHDGAVCATINRNIDVIGHRATNDIAVILLLLQSGDADANQHGINLRIA